jgi:microcystin-dependent protein/uncharacterized protein YjbI with pentapeptide repeats
MAYTIYKSDGTLLTQIADGDINITSTSIGLPGRNYASYGEVVDTNFVHILESFADSVPPANPLQGQLWFDTSSNRLRICPADGTALAGNWFTVASNGPSGITNFGSIVASGNITANNANITNNANVANINVSNANITLANITNVTASLANITTANISNVITTNANISVANITNANVSLANITDVVVSDSVWVKTTAANATGYSLYTTGTVAFDSGYVGYGKLNIAGGGGEQTLISGYKSGNTNTYGNLQISASNISFSTGAFGGTSTSQRMSIDPTGQVNVTSNLITNRIFTDNYYYANGVQLSFNGTYSNANVAAYLPTYTGTVGTGAANFIGTNITLSGNATAVGNVSSGNLLASGVVSATGNVTGGNLTTNGVVSATGNVTGGNLTTNGVVSATGNVTGGNLTTNGDVVSTRLSVQGNGGNDGRLVVQSATSNTALISALNNVAYTNGNLNVYGSKISFNTGDLGTNSTSERLSIYANGQISTVNGSNLVVSGNITSASTVTATGNISGGNLTTSGIVLATGTVAGGSFSTTGTLSVTGNANVGNIGAASGVFTGTISAASGITSSTPAVTQNVSDNSNKIATTAFVKQAIGANPPIGSVHWWTTTTAPTGYLFCDGSSVSQAAYPLLYAVIGATFGGNVTNFNLPDLRGQFIRGWNNSSSGSDPSRVFGSSQQDDFKTHTHVINDPGHSHYGHVIAASGDWRAGGTNSFPNATSVYGNTANAFTGITALNTGNTETRPVNVALMPIIRAYI